MLSADEKAAFDSKKISEVAKQLRQKKREGAPVSLAEFRAFCETHGLPQNVTSLDPHKAFISSYEIDEDSVHVMVTTPHLTATGASAECIQMDATFNIIWECYLLIVIGSQDKNRRFHKTSLHIVSQNEGTDVYKQVLYFNSISLFHAYRLYGILAKYY